MKIWLINSSEPTPLDEGEIRLLRMGILAKYLVNRGHQIIWWNADFLHPTKKHRFGTDKTIEIEPHYTIRFLHAPGYQKHISLARFWDHRVIAQKFLHESKNIEKPDVILCSLPTLDLADAATKYGKKYNVPVVLDIRDLWPDIFIEKTPSLLKTLVSLAITPLHFVAARSCQNAFAITGNTPKFVEWGLKKAKRPKIEYDKYFPFGYEEPEISVSEKNEIDYFWKSEGVKPEIYRYIITYIGTIGQNFQEEIVVQSAKNVLKKYNTLFVFCGGGDRLEELRLKYKENPNIIFPGWVNAKQIWHLMSYTTIALASYKDSENYRSSLTNKTIEYMAGGLPILFSIDDGYVADLIRDNEVGLTYGGSSERLADAINLLLNNEPYRNKLAQNSRRLFEQQFKADQVYNDFVSYLEKIALTQRR
ncbi:MAG: glycosyltransferase family 4 protein [Planctomycetaceae bacterium]|jgi:glycosyltransferase involved in cell wall biosynthesis|nr:glycosyltransferase family 4 protein [Planctomycetaceae bacterium]